MKRGFLLAEETLKIILAVIAISFLAYFLISLYLSNQDSKNLEFAKASLAHIVEEINSGKTEVEIYNPKGWHISSWEEGTPLSCSNIGLDSCLCICDGKNAEDCDDKGTCLESEFSIEGDIKIKDPPITLMIDQVNKMLSKK
jgi:hypothetical protein